jgi:hypothetical protein|tara:strand:+ start:9228 stop:9875 length:648 start_codon:yes stop_codon:yes gene_type:complete
VPSLVRSRWHRSPEEGCADDVTGGRNPPEDLGTRERTRTELAEKREEWHYRFEATKIRFEQEIHTAHRQLKNSIPRFIRQGRARHLLTAPVIYSAIAPIALIDLWLTLYQTVCFPLYGIPRVPRSRFLVVDRHHLAYLNGIEKLNCMYCGYANGVFAYVREVAARTEQFWCPIKHARRVPSPHSRYRLFFDYGDAEGYHRDLPKVRKDYDDVQPK